MSSRGLVTQRTPRLNELCVLGLAVPNSVGTKYHVNGTNVHAFTTSFPKKEAFFSQGLCTYLLTQILPYT
jgi:hypothetical protein